jgi:isoleucyl-tRNA synthetase
LYLEGSDQHRGWFQLSLLPGLGVTGRSPFSTVLTHGFMVTAAGQKMSKSLGNAIEVSDLLDEHGADVCRWWVASLSYVNDIKVDWEFFRVASDEYRKVRNTIRFMLGNLADFDREKDAVALGPDDALSVDAWAMERFGELVSTVTEAYFDYHFKRAREALFTFCNDTMSAVYLAATKDRLYCDAPDSHRRRRTQTTMDAIVSGLIRLAAPILVHTADEAWLAYTGADLKADDCVHLRLLPTPPAFPIDSGWTAAMELRGEVLRRIEQTKESLGVSNPLDLGVVAATPHAEELSGFLPEMADLCGVSRFELATGDLSITLRDLREEPRCERSWKRDGTVMQRSDGGWLSDRDAAVVGVS